MATKYIVILENDGMKPATAYYDRRSALALKVRGRDLNQNLAPLTRRSRGGEEIAAILQEGCIVTDSESQARMVAQLAQEYGIKSVYVGTTELTPFEARPADLVAWEKINAHLSRKGRKPDPEPWVVTCYEEMATYEVTAPEVFICPACHGTNLAARLGHANHVRPCEDGENILGYWLNTRFFAGHFEIPVVEDDPTLLPPTGFPDAEEQPLLTLLLSGQVGQAVTRLPLSEKGKLDLLDAAYLSRRYWPQETREQLRAQAIITWIRTFHGDAMGFPLLEEEAPDVLDALGPLGETRVLHVYQALKSLE